MFLAHRMLLDPRAIQIYTDGSCYKNPGGESGCAAIVHYPEYLNRPDEQILDFGCAESSINRMELMACIEAMKWVRRSAPGTI
jgi:ribonuclease HI